MSSGQPPAGKSHAEVQLGIDLQALLPSLRWAPAARLITLLGSKEGIFQVPTLSLTSCVTLHISQGLSGPSFSQWFSDPSVWR